MGVQKQYKNLFTKKMTKKTKTDFFLGFVLSRLWVGVSRRGGV
jgi:hypothetical protein